MQKTLSLVLDLPFRLRRTVVWPLIAATLPLVPMAIHAQALPSGGQVSAGQAQISTPAPNALTVKQGSQRAVIHWSGFGVGQGNSVTFVQPNAGAATLNVVDGSAPSTIAGSLKANGSVYLINRNGIAITPTGLVDVRAGFVASTLGMKDEDFMAGRDVFAGPGGAVVNRGQILAGPGGHVALLGGTVANEGLIRAPLGKVALGSAQVATLDLSGDGFLQVVLPADATTADGQALVTHSGVIEADGGTVMLKASTVREALRDAVHVPGEIRARGVSGRDGAIVLEAGEGGRMRVSGTLDVSAGEGASQGGRIDVSGQQIALAGATLSATGSERGGLVRIGGAFQGGKPQSAGSADAQVFAHRFGALTPLLNARTTQVDAASRIDVSATGADGVGGTTILWSDRATTAAGAIDARGAKSAGAVEVSSATQVQTIAFDRLLLGKGGRLLLDPQDIVIDGGTPTDPAGNIGYGSNPGTETRLRSADLIALLSTGTDVSLQASQDIRWSAGIATVTQPGAAKAGDMNLSAGRSITLTGVLTTADGNWTLVANDTAARGVIDADRGAGVAELDLSGAQFINNNGRLSLTMGDGAGNTYRDAGAIRLPRFQGDALTATISPTATGLAFGPRLLPADVSVTNAITLSGNIQVVSPVTLSGGSVNWTNEASASLFGEGTIKFVEAGALTRFGLMNGSDAARLALGSTTAVTHTYGDANPNAAGLGTSQLHVTSGTAGAALDAILNPGSITVAGPGATASVGSATLTLSAGANPSFVPGLMGGYFIDMRDGTAPLTITPRHVTATVSNGSYVYGTPGAVVGLTNLVNGDVLTPLATLDGTGGVAMTANGGGFGFGATQHAGSSAFTLTGLSGAAAGNYVLDFAGGDSGTLTIARKPLSYVVYGGGQTYGTLGAAPAIDLTGLVGGDAVTAVAGFSLAGTPTTRDARMNAGSYVTSVAALTGAAAGNYEIGTVGNTSGVFTVSPKALTWSVANAAGTYGTLTTLGAATLDGVLSGDAVTAVVGQSSGGPLTAATRAGTYTETVTGLTGGAAGNYQLAGSGNQAGVLTIAPKAITYLGGNVSQVYGTAMGTPTLSGLLFGDQVGATPQVTVEYTTIVGSGNAYPVGQYRVDVAALTGADAGNYTINRADSSASRVTVTPKPLTFQVGSASSVYGDTAVLPSVTLSGVVPGDLVLAVPTAFDAGGAQNHTYRTPAGTYTLGVGSLVSIDASNYTIAATGNSAGTLTVAPRLVNWQVGSGTAVYGNTLTNVTTLSNLVFGDDVRPTVSALDGLGAAISRPGVGSHAAGVSALSGVDAVNYVLASGGNTAGTVSITPRPVTFSVANVSAVYGTQAVAGAATLGNVLAGDTVGAVVDVRSGAGSVTLGPRTAAGFYTETVTALTGNPNYVLAGGGNADGVLAIARKPVSFDTSAASTVTTYGTAPSLATGSLSGVLAGDSVAAGATVLAGGSVPGAQQAAGHYLLAVGTLSGTDAANYEVTSAGSVFGSLRIDPKQLTYTLTPWWLRAATGDTRTYGELYQSGGDLRLTARTTLNGVVGNDDVGLSVTAPSLTTSTGGFYSAGTYRWTGGTLTGSVASNYVLASTGNTDGLLTIAQRPLDVSLYARSIFTGQIVPQVNYGGAATLLPTAVVTPLMTSSGGREQVNVSAAFITSQGAQPGLDTRAPVGTYDIGLVGGLTGADAGNYVARLVKVPLTVVPKPVTVQIADSVLSYGEGFPPAVTVSGVVAGDTLAATWQAWFRSDKIDLNGRTPVGIYEVQATGITGSAASNYVLTDRPSDQPPMRAGRVTIQPRVLSVEVDPRGLNLVYGNYLPGLTLGGVLFGDDVSVIGQARTTLNVPRDPSQNINAAGTLLDVGSYWYTGYLTGSKAGNYALPLRDPLVAPFFGGITVSPRPLSVVSLPTRNTVYGSYVAGQPVFDNLVPGQTVIPVYTATNDTTGAVATYTERSDAGRYTDRVTAISGPGSSNYVFDVAGSVGGQLLIAPKLLTLTMPSATNSTYGNTANLGKLSGVLFNDDIGLRTGGTAEMPSARLTLGADGTLGYTGRLDVGSYGYSVATDALVGTKSGNYRVAALDGGATVASGQLAVAQRELRYAVDNASGQYGNYKACELVRCYPWQVGIDYGQVNFDNLMVGDQVGGSVAMLDFKGGAVVPLDSRTPVGAYLQVVTGLTGASAKNYKIAETGSIPGLMTITPAWISYSTSNAVFIPGLGLVGNPGVPTLRGADGALSGPEVYAVVTARNRMTGAEVTDFSQLQVGTIEFRVTGLFGKDAGNYRVLKDSFLGAGYAINSVGALEVFADTRLGMNLVGVAPTPTLPVAVAPPPVAAAPTTGGNGLDVTVRRGEEPGALDFERVTTETGAEAGVTVNRTNVELTGSASGATGTSVNVGGVDLSAQAGATVDALARFGVTGVRIEAEANAHLEVSMEFGPGHITYGAQAEAGALVRLDRNGVAVTADASAGIYANAGLAGALGGAGTGTIDVTTGTFAYARAENRYGLVDGALTLTSEQQVGVGASVGGSAGLSGSVGAIEGGATLYSPGSLGFAARWTGGISNGALTVGLDLGAAIGLGGLRLSFNFTIDPHAAIGALAGAIFGSVDPSPNRLAERAAELKNDPVARFAFMTANPKWMESPYANAEGSVTFYNNYKALVDRTAATQREQAQVQATFLEMVKTDPQGAADYLRGNALRQSRTMNELTVMGWGVGVRMAAIDGALNFIKSP
ncbi:beta strand repeat-containing protein [Roseateles aquatilis]|uniref:beta strand repeat-containing protein n=1 Tax=Roseateles aquatilis TaxID=431061 RepID=UPI001131E2A8|nr:filamentous hemagglutinin N-terminal domain-containing protein [Roseateles aquatilis]